jgi:hypothetical protein
LLERLAGDNCCRLLWEVLTYGRKKFYHIGPRMAPEALCKSPKTINTKAADMWSFATLLWELATREVPFGHLTPMEAGMKGLDFRFLQSGSPLMPYSQHFIFFITYTWTQ